MQLPSITKGQVVDDRVTLALDELSPDQRFQRDLASYSQEHDLMKHLATLSTGSILLLATFLEKLFTHPAWTALVIVAFVGFVCSILGALTWQLLSLLHISAVRSQRAGLVAGRVVVPVLGAALGGFLVGIASLAVFAIRNLP
jgi:lysylphosphatidylglycerol synthetase-like protein (DUF2156 family)